MVWIYLAVVAGSILTSGHPTEEACLGRLTMLEKQNIHGACVRAPWSPPHFISSSPGCENCMAPPYSNSLVLPVQ